MALDTFVFTIALPADDDLLSLVREVSGHMTRYLGLSEDDARQARDVLDGVVATRLKQLNGTGPIVVRFERPPTGSTVQVEVTSAALPGGDSPPAPEARGVGSTGEDGHSVVRLSWRVHEGG